MALAANPSKSPFHANGLVNLDAMIENFVDFLFTRASYDKFNNVTFIKS